MKLRVIANAKKFFIKEESTGFKAYVDEKPENSRANLRLLQKLEEIIGRKVRLVKGAKSKNKIIEVDGNEKEILNKIREYAKKTCKNS